MIDLDAMTVKGNGVEIFCDDGHIVAMAGGERMARLPLSIPLGCPLELLRRVAVRAQFESVMRGHASAQEFSSIYEKLLRVRI